MNFIKIISENGFGHFKGCFTNVHNIYFLIIRKFLFYKKQVLNNDASVNETEVAAEYAVTKRQVLATPARMDEVEIPAEYGTILGS